MATAQTASARADAELQETTWDLEPLLDGEGPEGVERRPGRALQRGQAFAGRHAGRVAQLDAGGLVEAMHELAAIHELVGRAGTYAGLRFAADTSEPANGALLQLAQERGTAIETTLLFFELEWAALDDERAEALLAADGLDFCRHHLRNVRRYREHLLSEPEERILAEKALTGTSAWTRLFDELTSAIEVELPPPPAPAGTAESARGERAGSGDGAPGARDGAPGARGAPTDSPPPRVALDVALSRLMLADREL